MANCVSKPLFCKAQFKSECRSWLACAWSARTRSTSKQQVSGCLLVEPAGRLAGQRINQLLGRHEMRPLCFFARSTGGQFASGWPASGGLLPGARSAAARLFADHPSRLDLGRRASERAFVCLLSARLFARQSCVQLQQQQLMGAENRSGRFELDSGRCGPEEREAGRRGAAAKQLTRVITLSPASSARMRNRIILINCHAHAGPSRKHFYLVAKSAESESLGVVAQCSQRRRRRRRLTAPQGL